MPLKHGRSARTDNAPGYLSPIPGDTAFDKLEKLEHRHYVSLYGSKIRALIRDFFPPNHAFQTYHLKNRILRSGSITGASGKTLGESSVKHMIRPCLIWLAERGEVEVLPDGSYCRKPGW